MSIRSPIKIDKLIVLIPSKNYQIIVQNVKIKKNSRALLGYASNGEKVYGYIEPIINKKLHYTLKFHSVIESGFYYSYILLTMNPSLYNSVDGVSLSFKEFTEYFENVKDSISKFVNLIDIESASIYRIDLAKDCYMDESFEKYKENAFNILKPKYLKSIDENEKTKNHTSSYYLNKSRCICIYDKSKQLKKCKNFNTQSNLMRLEVRFIKKRTVGKYLKNDTVKSLLVRDQYNSLDKKYIQYLKDTLFLSKDEVNKPILSNDKNVNLLSNLKKDYKNNAFIYFIALKEEQKHTLLEIKSILKEAGYDKHQISKKIQDYNKLIMYKMECNKHFNDLQYKLYHELKSKFTNSQG